MSQDEERQPETMRTIGLFALDFLKVFIIAVAVIVPVRWFLFQPFVVTGDSMRPNFHSGNYLIIDELSYRLRDPARGEVVVLRFPNDPSQFFIKRLVGLPGERIVVDNGQVTIFDKGGSAGRVLQENYLPASSVTYGRIDRQLSADEYFVLGDNRLSSSDSRIWGPLKRKDIIGRVYLRLFPIRELQIFSQSGFSASAS